MTKPGMNKSTNSHVINDSIVNSNISISQKSGNKSNSNYHNTLQQFQTYDISSQMQMCHVDLGATHMSMGS